MTVQRGLFSREKKCCRRTIHSLRYVGDTSHATHYLTSRSRLRRRQVQPASLDRGPRPDYPRRRPPALAVLQERAVVFDGTCAAYTDPLRNYGIGSSQYAKTRYEISFRTTNPGPVLSTGGSVVRVMPSGKLNVTTIFQNATNVMESAGAVVGPNFNTLVLDVDKFGTCDTVLSATLNGAKMTVVQPFAWEGVRSFGIGADQQKLGGAGEEFFKGEIKSFKVSAFAD